MGQDMVVKYILKLFRVKPTQKNQGLLFTFLYNFIPAFIFAPYLIFVGLKYDLVLILAMGLLLFLVDLMHFIKAMRKILDENIKKRSR